MSPFPLDPDVPGSEEDEDGFSLEELSQSYSQLVQQRRASSSAPLVPAEEGNPRDALKLHDESESESAPHADSAGEGADAICSITPLSILEAVLFVGCPNGNPVTAAEIASLMRGVTESEVEQLATDLNQHYIASDRAIRVSQNGGGYRLEVAEELSAIKEQFYGPVRDIRLNQAAIDCLSLVAYQPGITREQLDEQRGQPSGNVLNQLVRRELLEIRREAGENKTCVCYYPTARLLRLAGLESLDDLPQAEELD